MAWKEFSIDESITRFSTGEGLIHVQEGNYLLSLSKIEPSPEDRDYAGEKGEPQNPFWRFLFQIEDGPDGIGKHLSYTGMFGRTKEDGTGGAWSVGRVLFALGADPSKLVNAKFASYKNFAAYAKQVETLLLKAGPKGRTGAEVSDNQSVNPRTGKVQVISNITAFFPADEWDKRKQSNRAPQPSNGVSTYAGAPAPSVSSPASQPEPAVVGAGAAPAESDDLEALVAQIMAGG